MRAAVHDAERHVEAESLVRADDLVRLVDRHLRILIAVEDEQRGIALVDVRHRTGQRRQRLRDVGLTAEQQVRAGCRTPRPNGVDCARIVVRFVAP